MRPLKTGHMARSGGWNVGMQLGKAPASLHNYTNPEEGLLSGITPSRRPVLPGPLSEVIDLPPGTRPAGSLGPGRFHAPSPGLSMPVDPQRRRCPSPPTSRSPPSSAAIATPSESGETAISSTGWPVSRMLRGRVGRGAFPPTNSSKSSPWPRSKTSEH